jgi:hypothetical protein
MRIKFSKKKDKYHVTDYFDLLYIVDNTLQLKPQFTYCSILY